MKKVLVLMLVLGMASLANAGLLIAPTSITVDPGQSAAVAVTTDSAISAGNGETYIYLIAPTGALSYDVGAAAVISGDCFIDTTTNAGSGNPAGTEGFYGGIFNFGAAYAIGSTIFGNLQVTGVTPGQYALTLYYVDQIDGATITGTAGSIPVTVTPEPATLAILGLGGLLLRRK